MNNDTPRFTQLQFYFESNSVIERFWAKVDRNGPNGCWLWTASLTSYGYGQIGIAGRNINAHRLSWELHNGPIPEHDSYHGYCVCHTCDNRRCVNPAHLFLGTQKDNLHDMAAKGRKNTECMRGEGNPNSKLTSSDVCAIRELASQGVGFREIGRRFGVGHSTIGGIVRRQWYAWIE
jgi:hypothetical protein